MEIEGPSLVRLNAKTSFVCKRVRLANGINVVRQSVSHSTEVGI